MAPEDTSTSGDTEERILEAALHVFSIKGKDGARTQEIADHAGINKALLHYYFRSKDRLYESVFEYVLAKLSETLRPGLTEAGSFHDVLHLFIDRYIDFVAGNLAVMRLIVWENLSGGERMAERIGRLIGQTESPPRVFLDRLQQAVADGEIRPVDGHQTLITVLSNCIFFFLIFPSVRAISPVAAESRDLFIRQRKEHVLELMSSWLSPAPASQPPERS